MYELVKRTDSQHKLSPQYIRQIQRVGGLRTQGVYDRTKVANSRQVSAYLFQRILH